MISRLKSCRSETGRNVSCLYVRGVKSRVTTLNKTAIVDLNKYIVMKIFARDYFEPVFSPSTLFFFFFSSSALFSWDLRSCASKCLYFVTQFKIVSFKKINGLKIQVGSRAHLLLLGSLETRQICKSTVSSST